MAATPGSLLIVSHAGLSGERQWWKEQEININNTNILLSVFYFFRIIIYISLSETREM